MGDHQQNLIFYVNIWKLPTAIFLGMRLLGSSTFVDSALLQKCPFSTRETLWIFSNINILAIPCPPWIKIYQICSGQDQIICICLLIAKHINQCYSTHYKSLNEIWCNHMMPFMTVIWVLLETSWGWAVPSSGQAWLNWPCYI